MSCWDQLAGTLPGLQGRKNGQGESRCPCPSPAGIPGNRLSQPTLPHPSQPAGCPEAGAQAIPSLHPSKTLGRGLLATQKHMPLSVCPSLAKGPCQAGINKQDSWKRKWGWSRPNSQKWPQPEKIPLPNSATWSSRQGGFPATGWLQQGPPFPPPSTKVRDITTG